MREGYKKYLLTLIERAKNGDFSTANWFAKKINYDHRVREDFYIYHKVKTIGDNCYILKVCLKQYYNGDYFEGGLSVHYMQLYCVSTKTNKIKSFTRVSYGRPFVNRAKQKDVQSFINELFFQF